MAGLLKPSPSAHLGLFLADLRWAGAEGGALLGPGNRQRTPDLAVYWSSVPHGAQAPHHRLLHATVCVSRLLTTSSWHTTNRPCASSCFSLVTRPLRRLLRCRAC